MAFAEIEGGRRGSKQQRLTFAGSRFPAAGGCALRLEPQRTGEQTNQRALGQPRAEAPSSGGEAGGSSRRGKETPGVQRSPWHLLPVSGGKGHTQPRARSTGETQERARGVPGAHTPPTEASDLRPRSGWAAVYPRPIPLRGKQFPCRRPMPLGGFWM